MRQPHEAAVRSGKSQAVGWTTATRDEAGWSQSDFSDNKILTQTRCEVVAGAQATKWNA